MGTFNEETMRGELFEILDDLKSELAKVKPGSEEHSRITKDIQAICGVIHEDYKIANILEQTENSAELDKRKYLENAKQVEREISLKERQAIADSKWYNKQIVQTIIVNGTVAAVCVGGMIINCKSETPLINGVSQWMMKILGAAR